MIQRAALSANTLKCRTESGRHRAHLEFGSSLTYIPAMGWFNYLLRKLRGKHDTHASPPATSEPPADDFVARYGLSYGQTADPVSYNAKVEVAKALRKPNGRAR